MQHLQDGKVIISPEIYNLSNLRHLGLIGLRLDTIYLTCNEISEIPRVIEKLNKLVTLSIMCNKITCWPNNINIPNLEYLLIDSKGIMRNAPEEMLKKVKLVNSK